MNRKQRRHGQTACPMTVGEAEHLKKEMHDISWQQVCMVIAAFCLVLHRRNGYGPKRLTKLMESVQQECLEALCAQELIDKCATEAHFLIDRSQIEQGL